MEAKEDWNEKKTTMILCNSLVSLPCLRCYLQVMWHPQQGVLNSNNRFYSSFVLGFCCSLLVELSKKHDGSCVFAVDLLLLLLNVYMRRLSAFLSSDRRFDA